MQHVGPVFMRVEAEEVVIGVRVCAHHTNRAGTLHGGMFGTLADVAIGNNIAFTRWHQQGEELPAAPTAGSRPPMATVSMSTDFVGTAKLGDWVEVRVDVQKAGRTLAYANAYLICDGERIGRVSAVFRLFA